MDKISNHTAKIFTRVGIFLGTLLLLYIIFKFAVYFMPFLIAAVIAMIIEPIIKFCMNKLKMSRRVSSVIVVGITIILFTSIVIFGGIALVKEIISLSSNMGPMITKVIESVQDMIGNIAGQYPELPEQVVVGMQNSIIDFIGNIGGLLQDWSGKALSILLSVPTMLINIVITVLALIFFTKDRIYVIDMLEHHMPKTWIKKMLEVIKEIFSTLGGYIRVYTKIILITFAELYIAFTIYNLVGLKLNYTFTLAVVIAIIDILPILGVGTVLIPWCIYSLVIGDFPFAIAVGITYITIFIIRQFMEPKLVSKQFGIHPLITLFAMYAGFKAAGVIGLIIGPVTLMILRCIFSKQIESGLFKDMFDEK